MSEELETTRDSVQRMQDFDTESLPRENELGKVLSFREAVRPAKKLVDLYKQLSLTVLDDIPDTLLAPIKSCANADFNLFKQVLDFDINQEHPTNARDSHVQQISNAYPTALKTLHTFISYGASKSTDFQRMETEARASIQAIKDRADKVTQELEKSSKQANDVLEDVRRAAAEQGVSQQAIYFKDESQAHLDSANKWRWSTIWLAVALGVYSVSTLFFHNFPWLAPENDFQSVQLVASKFLIFGVLSYMVLLSAKNFLSHKHNAIINKHRQNALMTFNALVDASGDDNGKEIILNHASACIFAPQDTGYVKYGADRGSAKSMVEFLPRAMIKGAGS